MDIELLAEVRAQVEPSDFEDTRKRSFVLGWACIAVPEGSKVAALIEECETFDSFTKTLDLLIEVATMGPVAV